MISALIELVKRTIELCLHVVEWCIPVAVIVLILVVVVRVLNGRGITQGSTRGLPWPIQQFRAKLLNRIQFQMILVFAVSALAFLIVTNASNAVVGRVISSATMDYSNSMKQMDDDAQQMASEIENATNRSFGENGQPMSVQATLNQQARGTNEKIYIVNPEGHVVLSSDNADETQVSIQKLIGQVSRTTLNSAMNSPDYTPTDSIVRMYPVQYNQHNDYVVVEGVPIPNIVYTQANNPLSTVLGLAAFILTFYLLTRRKMGYLQELSQGLHQIAGGNLSFRVRRHGSDELARLAEDINGTASALQQKIEAERLAEKTKSELITNVSHDLRTPLTLITGYLTLLKDRKYQNDQQYDEYVSIASDKAEKLNGLIETLFEYTKLSNQGVRLVYQDVSLNELISQLLEEMVSVAEASDVQFHPQLTDERLWVHVDPNQISRVFENLLSNSIQHSRKPGKVNVRLFQDGAQAVFEVSNLGDPIPPEEVPRLFERFYRSDHSRTSTKGGSGLGLAIAKSIVDLHGGEIHCEADGDEIRFIVKLPVQAQSVMNVAM